MAKKIAIDLDGFLTTTSVKGTHWIPGFLCLFVLKVFKPKPRNKKIVWLWKWKKKGGKIIIISARPEITRGVTEKWLKNNKVPFDELVLVGTGKVVKKKWKVIREKEISYYYGDNPKTIEYLKEKGVKATLN